MAVTAAMIGGGAMLGGSVFSGIFGSSAAKQQANAIKEAAQIARQTALEIDTRARADVSPFRALGMESGAILSKIMSGEMNLDAALGQSSIFKWQQSEGERALNRELSARGLYNSGAGLETLARFNTQLMGEEGLRYWDRLFNVTTLGSNAAARMASNTTQTGNTLMGVQGQLGQAQAQSIGDQYRSIGAIGQGIGQAGQLYASAGLYGPLINSYANRTPSNGATSLSQYGPYQSGYQYDSAQWRPPLYG